jgi:superfamily II DNA or RNA helicase
LNSLTVASELSAGLGGHQRLAAAQRGGAVTKPALSPREEQLTLTPDRLQKRALAALASYVGDGGRAVLVMPCGSGKTLVGRWLAERVDAKLAVVCVPTLALLPQTLKAWRMDGSGWAHRSMIVGSDPTSGQVVRVDDLALPGWAREEVRASTSVNVIAEFLRGPGTLLIFSTYHSAPRVAAALRRAGKIADLLVCDEGHRLTGRPRDEFRAVLDDQRFPARRRVAMTATPVEAAAWQDDLDDGALYGDSLSLDDIVTFGPVAYRATFADAVAAGRLVDYDVHVLAKPSGTDSDDRAANAGAAVLSAIEDGATRILTFHTRVSHAAELAEHLDGRIHAGKRVAALYLESAHTARERQDVLDHLAAPAANEVVVVCSARVLSEGVDVPAVDTVIFADPRTSSVDIVQATGRAMRTAPGKARGRIVLTVDLGDSASGLDDDSRFAASRWRHVWHVLRALASMDPRFRREMQRQSKGPVKASKTGPALIADLPEGWDAQRWMLRALDNTGAAWWERFRDLERFAARNGHARPTLDTDKQLGLWVIRQRAMWRDGFLDEDRIRALERLPGWVWSGRDAGWWRAWESWHHLAATAGMRRLSRDRWMAALAEAPVDGRGRHKSLAEFAVDTCLRRRRGELPANLEKAAELLHGWQWDMLPGDDAAMIDALGEYAAWKKTMNVPPSYLHDDGLRLGAWLTSVRRRRYTGRISVVLQAALNMLSASLAGQGIEKLNWDAAGTGWRLGYLALRQYQAREGTCHVPYQAFESLPDIELNLSRWCAVQRQQYRLGNMSPERITALEQVPGWQWEVELRPGYRPELDDAEHGTRHAYAKGCRCDPCTDANSSYEHARTNGNGTDLVDARRARGKVWILRGQGASQKALARAGGVNVKTIAELEQEVLTRIRPETEECILALTIEEVRKAEKAGRWGGTEPAGPVLQLIDEMVALGWSKAWIAREIEHGNGRRMQLGRDHATVSVSQARRVRELRQRIGSLNAPSWRRCEGLPPLAEILADRDHRESA